MASLGNGDVGERKNVGYFLDRGVGRDVASVHFGHSLEFITRGIPVSSLLTKFGNWVLTPVQFSENSSRGTASWLSETGKKTSSIRPKITR